MGRRFESCRAHHFYSLVPKSILLGTIVVTAPPAEALWQAIGGVLHVPFGAILLRVARFYIENRFFLDNVHTTERKYRQSWGTCFKPSEEHLGVISKFRRRLAMRRIS